MIQSTELRIGNRFIREIHSPRGLDYDNDFVLTEEWMGKLFGANTSIALNDLSGILLTPEILEKCGFIILEDEGLINYKLTLPIIIAPNSDNKYSLIGIGQKSLIGFKTIAYTVNDYWASINLKYLHQLQNLYFALTGEELSINI